MNSLLKYSTIHTKAEIDRQFLSTKEYFLHLFLTEYQTLDAQGYSGEHLFAKSRKSK